MEVRSALPLRCPALSGAARGLPYEKDRCCYVLGFCLVGGLAADQAFLLIACGRRSWCVVAMRGRCGNSSAGYPLLGDGKSLRLGYRQFSTMSRRSRFGGSCDLPRLCQQRILVSLGGVATFVSSSDLASGSKIFRRVRGCLWCVTARETHGGLPSHFDRICSRTTEDLVDGCHCLFALGLRVSSEFCYSFCSQSGDLLDLSRFAFGSRHGCDCGGCVLLDFERLVSASLAA
ncbi:unnamed protein product [Arabidopsis lyrata]|nr:unnamed protein product [Arabidopsis lyrata]